MTDKTFKFNDFVDDASRVSSRPTDYIQSSKNAVDNYPFGLAHGVQKDAIQNGWDACKPKTKNHVSVNWGFKFELLKKNDYTFLSMTDKGTTGLTGSMTAKNIDPEVLPPEEERWARWESLAVPKEGEEDLGARGQGKMILIAASKDYAIIYDSLRSDGTYRLGMSQAKHNDCPIIHWDGDVGKNFIKANFGIDPLGQQGTRVLIVNPVDQLIDSIKSGEFGEFISETWWPLFTKFGANIYVANGEREIKITPPSFFPIDKKVKETENFKIWIKDEESFSFEGNRFLIKRLHFACDKLKDAPELHQGVAVFRLCMKVPILGFQNRDYGRKVYGYAEFDEKIDKELRKIELTNHYAFKNKGIWRKIKEVIETELDKFGNEKLGLGIDRRAIENNKRNSAENTALGILKKITKGWHLGKTNIGVESPETPPVDTPEKDIAIVLNNLIFPNPGNVPRLNYGEKLENFFITVFNKTPNDLDLTYEVFLQSGSRNFKNLDKCKIKLNPGLTLESDKYSILADKKLFPDSGEYSIKAILKNNTTGNREDEVTRKIWVETDPPYKGPFDVKRVSFGPEKKKMEWYLEPKGSGAYVLLYNIDHSAYLHYDENESTLIPYLSEIFGMAALQLFIKKINSGDIDKTKLKELPFDFEKLVDEDPRTVSLEISMAFSSMKSKIYELI